MNPTVPLFLSSNYRQHLSIFKEVKCGSLVLVGTYSYNPPSLFRAEHKLAG